MMEERQSASQHQLFPMTLNFSPNDTEILKDLREICLLGFDVQEFGGNSFVVNAVPAELAGKQNERSILESLLEQHKIGLELQLQTRESIARSMARTAAVKRGQLLSELGNAIAYRPAFCLWAAVSQSFWQKMLCYVRTG